MLKEVKLFVFDMAGTTVVDNDEVLHCFSDACYKSGLIASRDRLNALMGWSKLEVFKILWNEQSPNATDIESKADHSYTMFREILEAYYQSHSVLPTVGALEIFGYLRSKNIKIVLNTGFYRKVTDIILDKLHWHAGSTFDLSISSDEVPQGRPSPFMIQKAMTTFEIESPQQVVKIGDTPVDLLEGRAAHCHTFGLTNGTHTKAELEKLDSDGLFESLLTFKDFLETALT